jgi:hypothetical protein
MTPWSVADPWEGRRAPRLKGCSELMAETVEKSLPELDFASLRRRTSEAHSQNEGADVDNDKLSRRAGE